MKRLHQQYLYRLDREADSHIQDWVKPPRHKGAWHTFHQPHRLLQYYLEYADKVNGIIFNTICIAIASQDSTEFEIKLSPMCATEHEDLGIFLPFGVISQLGLHAVGEYATRNYGLVKTYSGIKIRLEGTRSSKFVYTIPDGYVYELPHIYSSASLASVSPNGIPQRQGILHREILYQHAIVYYNKILYSLSEKHYHGSGIPEVMIRNPRCNVLIEGKHGTQPKKININSILRPMDQQRELDEVHPCFLNDFFIKESIPPPIVYYTVTPRCFQCKKTTNLFYCSLCRKRYVQNPHVYCSQACQKEHWVSEHCNFHLSPQTEQHINVVPLHQTRRDRKSVV